jgi:hypothetical protein
MKTLAQFAGNRIYYLKILQIARYLFDWKPAWMADLRVVQDGLFTKLQRDLRSQVAYR